MIHIVAFEAAEANEVHGVADVFVVEGNDIGITERATEISWPRC